MRHYSKVDEERIRVQALVREWTRAGLIDTSQRARLEADLPVDVRRTNNFLRAGLALFTALIVGASVFLVVIGFDSGGRAPVALAFGLMGVLCVWLADRLSGRFRFYRFGVEEALAVAAVLLLGISAAELISNPPYGVFREQSWIVGLLVGTAGGFGVYRRFGFVYAAIGSMACAAAIPFQMNLPNAGQNTLAAAILTSAFMVARSKRLRDGDDYPGDEYALLQPAALAGIYIVLNLQLRFDLFYRTARISSGPFYWFTYLAIWIVPVVGLGLSIREKDRVLLDVGVAMALATLLTNKLYLGWPRHTWDPMLLGVVLMAVAIGLRRWLSSAPGGERRGFTAARLVGKDSAVLTVLRVASAAYRPDSASSVSRGPRDEPAPPSDFSGGRSGGGGGGGAY